MISLLGFFFFVFFGILVSNASGNGAKDVLLALFIFSIGFQDCTRRTNVYTYWCVCACVLLLAQPMKAGYFNLENNI